MSLRLTAEDLELLDSEEATARELLCLVSTAELADQVADDSQQKTYRLPWRDLDHLFGLRDGELTVWAGESGSGKSLLLGQVMGWLLAREHRICIASLEMRLSETLKRMCNQMAGCTAGTQFRREWCSWAEGRIWLYDEIDTVATDRLLTMVRVSAKHLGCQHIVIDSLTKAGVRQDGDGYLTEQTRFVDRLQHLAKHLGVHIHLVAHLRKPQARNERPSKHDVRGASQITDLADNVVLIARNRRKEELSRLPPEALDEDDQEILRQPDAWLEVAKQRHTSWEGRIGLDYDHESQQYHGHNKPLLEWPAPGFPLPWRL